MEELYHIDDVLANDKLHDIVVDLRINQSEASLKCIPEGEEQADGSATKHNNKESNDQLHVSHDAWLYLH